MSVLQFNVQPAHPIYTLLAEAYISPIISNSPARQVGLPGSHIPVIDFLPSVSVGTGHATIDVKPQDYHVPLTPELSPCLPCVTTPLKPHLGVIDLTSPPVTAMVSAIHPTTICKDESVIELLSSPIYAARPSLPLVKRARSDSSDSVEILAVVSRSRKVSDMKAPQEQHRHDASACFAHKHLPSPGPFPFELRSKPQPLQKLKRRRSASVELISPSCQDVKQVTAKQKRIQGIAPGVIRQGSFFKTWEDARDALYEQEGALGHKWIKHQTKMTREGSQAARITFRCNRQSQHIPKHSMAIDPSDHRHGQSVRVGCRAHVNVCKNAGGWIVSLADFEHNHERLVPVGGSISRPPTQEQRVLIAGLAKVPKLSRSQIMTIVETKPEFSKPLEPRQVSNVMAKARSDT